MPITPAHRVTQRRRLLTDDLLIGATLVTFFVMLGVLMTVVMVDPTPGQRVPCLLLGIVLGFSMLYGALRVARFRADAADQVVRRTTTIDGRTRTVVDVGREG